QLGIQLSPSGDKRTTPSTWTPGITTYPPTARNVPLPYVTPLNAILTPEARALQLIPSSETRIMPPCPTTTQRSPPYVRSQRVLLVSGEFAQVHFKPSSE